MDPRLNLSHMADGSEQQVSADRHHADGVSEVGVQAPGHDEIVNANDRFLANFARALSREAQFSADEAMESLETPKGYGHGV